MKSNIIFVTLLITFAWVSSLETARIQSNSQLVEEFLELKNSIKAPQPSVKSLVAEIVMSAENTSSYKADFATITDNCKTLLDLINAYIKNLKGDILAEEAARNEASSKIGKSNKEKEKLTKQITKAQEEFQKLIKKAVADRHHFEQTKIEIEEKLNIVKRLRDIVTDELVNEESKASTTKKSFIQIKTFNDILAELKSKVEKMEDKTLFAPLVDALVSLATSQHFSDQKILKKILDVLDKLENNLKNFDVKLDKDFKEIRKLNGKNQSAVREEIEALKKVVAISAQEEKYNEQIYQHATNSIKLLNAQLAKKQNELKYLQKMCDYENKLISNYNKELAADLAKFKGLLNAAASLK